MRSVVCLIGLLAFSEFPIQGQEKATGDINEPLPPGAVERLGSSRIRVAGSVIPATAMAFAPDGKKLLAAGVGNVVLHDLEGKAGPLELQLPNKAARNKSEEKSKPNHIAVSSDGNRIAGGWDDGVVCLWDTSTGKLLWQRDGHELSVSSVAFMFGDKELVTTGSYDGAMHWWNVADGKRKGTFAVDADKAIFQRRHLMPAPCLTTVFCDRGRLWEEYELATRQVRRELAVDGYLETSSPDGRFFLTASEDCYRLIEAFSGKSQRIFGWIDVERPHYNRGCRARFSPNSRMIAGVAGKDVVHVWDRDTGTVLASLAGHPRGAVAVAFAPDGKRIATSANDGTVLLWKCCRTPARPPRWSCRRCLTIISRCGKDSEGASLPERQRACDSACCAFSMAPPWYASLDGHGKSILAQTNGGVWIDLWLWDAATGKLQRQIEVTGEYYGHSTGPPSFPHWEVSQYARYLLTWNTFLRESRERSPLRVRDIHTGKVVFEQADPEKNKMLNLHLTRKRSLTSIAWRSSTLPRARCKNCNPVTRRPSHGMHFSAPTGSSSW